MLELCEEQDKSFREQPMTTDGLKENNNSCFLHPWASQVWGLIQAISLLGLSPRCSVLYSIHQLPAASSLTSPSSVSLCLVI